MAFACSEVENDWRESRQREQSRLNFLCNKLMLTDPPYSFATFGRNLLEFLSFRRQLQTATFVHFL